jgi:uncharacterized membrane protein
MLLRGFIIAILVSLAASQNAAAEKVASKAETKEGKAYVTIENPFMKLTFTPFQGGRCSKFLFKDTEEEIIGSGIGMFLDHWAKYPWPSGLMWLPYEYTIVGDGKTKVGIQLWIVVPPMGGGKGASDATTSSHMETSPELIGLIVRKTIWLNAENDVILVEQEIENPTNESRSIAPYVQHACNMGGVSYNDNWYLPSTQGVVVNIQPSDKNGKVIGPDWVLDPTTGWMAVCDNETKRGLVFAFDYNYLQKIYTCGSTAEWFMESAPVGPGGTFTFYHIIKPVQGFKDFVYASENIVADIRPDEVNGKVRVYHDIAAMRKELSDVDVEFTVISWNDKVEIVKKKMRIDRIGFDKIRQEFEFDPKGLLPNGGVVIQMVVQGADFKNRYEYYYAGDDQEYERRYNFHATKGGALAGTKGKGYYLEPPAKVKTIEKPRFEEIPRPAEDKFKCLVVFGLYTHILHIDDALAEWSHRGIKPEFTWSNCPPNAVEIFPGTYDELFSYHTIILSDVNYKAIGDIGFEMICDYVQAGGKLLVIGGPYALGNGEFGGTRFLEVLPVTLSGPFDLKWAGKEKSWELEPAAPDHSILKGVSFAENPRVYWHHFVTPKAKATVVLKVSDKPALILGEYGKGKVVVLTLSPTGEGNEGETEWWDWEGWFPLVKNICTWLNESS